MGGDVVVEEDINNVLYAQVRRAVSVDPWTLKVEGRARLCREGVGRVAPVIFFDSFTVSSW